MLSDVYGVMMMGDTKNYQSLEREVEELKAKFAALEDRVGKTETVTSELKTEIRDIGHRVDNVLIEIKASAKSQERIFKQMEHNFDKIFEQNDKMLNAALTETKDNSKHSRDLNAKFMAKVFGYSGIAIIIIEFIIQLILKHFGI